jgi:NitT/TauT family transport system ATP-binding protein
MDGAARLEFRQVAKSFRARTRKTDPVSAVRDISFSIRHGEVVSLIGPSGCGKSTLLNMAAGLDQPSAGVVLVDGKPVTSPNPHVAFMLQNDLLLPWRTILENVNLGQEIQHVEREERTKRSADLLARYHLGEFAHHYPHQLSGGMRQRAALARTMVMDPDVMLLDEPFSALDAQTKIILQNDLASILAEERKTALFITHDISEGLVLSDRVLVMSRRPGTIIREIVVDMPDRAKPFHRRSNPRMNAYMVEIFDLLGLTEHDTDDDKQEIRATIDDRGDMP